MTLPETRYIPRAADFATVQIPVPEAVCGQCRVPLRAFPWYAQDGSVIHENLPVKDGELWYHPAPSMCLPNARRERRVTGAPTVELDLATGRRSLGTIESPSRLATTGGGPTER